MKISQIIPLLKLIHSAGNTLLIKGESGIGKSQIVNQFSKQNNFGFEPLMLGQQEVGDIIGIPNNIKIGSQTITTWGKPYWLKNLEDYAWPQSFKFSDLIFNDSKFEDYCINKDEYTRDELSKIYCDFYNIKYNPNILMTDQLNVECILSQYIALFLDELNRGDPSVMGAALQLVLDRQIHQHVLPIVKGKLCLIVAAINPDDSETQEYQVRSLDPAMLDRFLHVDAEVDAASWLDWARENSVNKCVREFIAENNDFIYNVPENDRIATPRSWVMLAKHVDQYEQGLVPEELLMTILSGMVGKSIGVRLYTFIRNFKKGLTQEEIIKVTKEDFQKHGNIQKTAKVVEELFKSYDIDQIVMQEKTEQLMELLPEVIEDKNFEIINCSPLFAMLYALPLETLASVIYKTRDSNSKQYKILANMDDLYNRGTKELFMKLSSIKFN